MSTGCHMRSTDLCKTFIRFRASWDSSARGLLLSDTNRRGLCASSATSSVFLHTLSICGCHMMTWTHYSDHLVAVGDLCVVPGQCLPDYID